MRLPSGVWVDGHRDGGADGRWVEPIRAVERREVAERRVQAPAVVPAFDPCEDRGLQLAAGRPGAAAGELFLELAKNASQTALPSEQPWHPSRRDPGGASSLTEDQRHVLAAPVADESTSSRIPMCFSPGLPPAAQDASSPKVRSTGSSLGGAEGIGARALTIVRPGLPYRPTMPVPAAGGRASAGRLDRPIERECDRPRRPASTFLRERRRRHVAAVTFGAHGFGGA
jgi:hypothetical protein